MTEPINEPARAPKSTNEKTKNMKLSKGLKAILFSLLATAGMALSAPDSPMGTNLTSVVDFSSEFPFADHFKQARPWISGNSRNGAFDDGRSLRLNGNGEITSLKTDQVARTVMFTGLPADPTLKDKKMIVRYDGEGRLEYNGQVTLLSRNPGRDVIQLKGGSEVDEAIVIINLVRTNAANPLRRVRMTPTGGISRSNPLKAVSSASAETTADFVSFEQAATQNEIIFNPAFLNSIKSYRSIRFMDWLQTNNSPQVNFADRGQLSHQFWSTDRGVPLEAAIELCNLMNLDPWLNIPHLATDSYVREFATLLKSRLKPSLRASIEYSNETWNGIFTQTGFVENKGLELGLDAPRNDRFISGLRFYSKRAQRVFDIFNNVYGSERAARIKRVMASQSANPFTTETVLSFTNAAKKTDAFAIAPYFGETVIDETKASEIKRLGVDGIFDWLQNDNNAILERSLPFVDREVAAQKATAKSFSIPLITYEGGQHFVGAFGFENDDQLNAIMDAVNKDPRMKGIYLTYLNNWRNRSNQVFMHFVSVERHGKFGRWGAREFAQETRSQAPKFDAIQTYISQRPLP